VRGAPIAFTGNRIDSTAPLFYRANGQFAPSANTYRYSGGGTAHFTLGNRRETTLASLQAAGFEAGSTLTSGPAQAPSVKALRLDADIDFALDADGLLASAPLAQLSVLRSLARQYGLDALAVTVHLHTASHSPVDDIAVANAIGDLDAGPIHFDRAGRGDASLHLLAANGRPIREWRGFQNAATLGGFVRREIGAPQYPFLTPASPSENKP